MTETDSDDTDRVDGISDPMHLSAPADHDIDLIAASLEDAARQAAAAGDVKLARALAQASHFWEDSRADSAVIDA